MGFEATHAALRRMGMNNEFNYTLGKSRPDPHLPLPEQYCRTRSSEGKKPRGSNARLQALLQRPARCGRCGVGPEDCKKSVRCSCKLRHGPVLYMVQHAGGVNLAPIRNRPARPCRCVRAVRVTPVVAAVGLGCGARGNRGTEHDPKRGCSAPPSPAARAVGH